MLEAIVVLVLCPSKNLKTQIIKEYVRREVSRNRFKIMPVRGSGKTVNKDAEKRKEEILRRIQASRPLVLDEDIEISDDENDEKCRQESLQVCTNLFRNISITMYISIH